MVGMSKRIQPPSRWPGRHRRARPVISGAVLALAVLFLTVPQVAVSQETDGERVTITGRVIDVLSGDPIAGVEVVIRGGGGPEGDFFVETDANGRFQLAGIAVGDYRLTLSHFEYNPAVGEFTVMRAGEFTTEMLPLDKGSNELMTGIIGEVTDRETGALLSGVHVTMGGGGEKGVFSDSRGEFVLDRLVGGQHVVEFSMIGYSPRADTVRVVPGRVTTVDVSLSVDPVVLDPIEVAVERREIVLQRRGFYHRQKVGFGKYIDREQIEATMPSEMTDLFSGMAGVELYSDPFNHLEKWVVLRTGRHSSIRPREIPEGAAEPEDPTDIYERCFPRVYVDGIIAHRGGDEPARMDTFVDPMTVSGVEVYPTVSGLPPEYQGHGSFCGTILIWTRR